MTWRPIDTAPELDRILVRKDDGHLPPYTFVARKQGDHLNPQREVVWTDDNGFKLSPLHFTHWMPLPSTEVVDV